MRYLGAATLVIIGLLFAELIDATHKYRGFEAKCQEVGGTAGQVHGTDVCIATTLKVPK